MKARQILAALLALFLALGLGGTALASEEAASAETAADTGITVTDPFAEPDMDCDEVLVVVHTNDVHGFIDVEPYVKAVADDMKAQYGTANVLTLSAGDVFAGGNAVAHLYKGETIPPIMDAAGYDMMTPGNNDFFLGADQLLVLADMFAHTQVVCSNLYELCYDENGEKLTDEAGYAITGDPVFPRTMTVETAGGVKVGVFGLTIAGGTGDGPIDNDFASTGSVQTAREAVDILRNEQDCAVVIGVGHTGWNDDLVTPSANDVTSATVVREAPGIDVFVDGHSHSIINGGTGWVCPETGTLVNQASCKGACVGVMKIFLKDGAVIGKNATLLSEEYLQANYEPDPVVQALVDETWERLNSDPGEMYIVSEYFLNGQRASENEDGRSIRTDETNLGDLVADFIRDYADADVGMAAGFTIRSSIDQGEIYTLNLYDVFANGCYLYAFDVTGEELLEKMASSLRDLPTESPSFKQISGASYGYIKDGTTYTIIDPMVGGEPLDPQGTYRIVTNDNQDEEAAGGVALISTMEEAVAAMGEYLKSGRAVILPDVPTPDNRVVPMDEIPDGAVVYEITLTLE